MLVQRLLFSRLAGRCALCVRYSSTDRLISAKQARNEIVPLSSLKPDELGHSILLCKETMPPGSPKSPHDVVATSVFVTKVLSLSSSVAGVIMVPVLSTYLWDAAAE
ncbi:unnamed protein product, partial [Strongylus vulgaris]